MKVSERWASMFWCPMVRDSEGNRRGVEHAKLVEEEAHDIPVNVGCLGASCMAWQWMDPDSDSSNDYGYCGLAGKPRGA